MKNLLTAFAVLAGASARADVKFHCYPFKGLPVSVYEYASGSTAGKCMPSEPVKKPGDLAAGDHEVICSMPAACAPVSADAPLPETLSDGEVKRLIMRDRLKMSTLMCKGHLNYSGGSAGRDEPVTCPLPSECRDEVYYNLSATLLSIPSYDPVLAPGAPSKAAQ